MSYNIFYKLKSKANYLMIEFLRKKVSDVYDRDKLITEHNHDFMKDPKFIKAYKRGVKANKFDYHIEWRIHVALRAAFYAKNLSGDFVECGFNRGIFSSSIMDYLNWNKLSKKFYLLDTFCGIDEKQLSKEEIAPWEKRRK